MLVKKEIYSCINDTNKNKQFLSFFFNKKYSTNVFYCFPMPYFLNVRNAFHSMFFFLVTALEKPQCSEKIFKKIDLPEDKKSCLLFC